MKREHLRAAARCWERALSYEGAAECFGEAEDWLEAGRCFSQAGLHHDAALAYSYTGDLLLEAREQLMASWPEQVQLLYERLRLKSWRSPAPQVELLLGLGELEEAIRIAKSSGNREALKRLFHLTTARGRLDVAATLSPQRVGHSWESFNPWNRSLRWHLPATEVDQATWPSIKLGEVSLVSIWQEAIGGHTWGDRALDWSADGTFFVAALKQEGLARGAIGPSGTQLGRWKLSGAVFCCRFLPASHSILAGLSGGGVSLLGRDGSVQHVECLRMPNNVVSIAFATEGDRLALAAKVASGALLKVSKWREEHGEALLDELRESDGNCAPLTAWSPDGRGLCWSPGPANQPNRLFLPGQPPVEAHADPIASLAFSTDGRFLVTSSCDRTVVVRDGATGQALEPPEHFAAHVHGASLHPKAALLAVGEGNRLHLLRLDPGEVPGLSRLSEQKFDEGVQSLSFSPDGRHLLVMTESHLRLFCVDLKP